MTEFIGGVTPNPDQQTGYARLTVDSVNVQDGFEASADLTGTFAAGFEEVPVISPSVSGELDGGGTEVFVIGIHSVDPGTAGIGSSLVGKIDSLIGIKILETGSYSNVEVPIYPINDATVVRVFEENDDRVAESQQFPPIGTGLGGPDIQAAIYTELFFGGELPDSTAESSVIEVNGGLNPDDIPPLVPVKDGEFDYKLTQS
jgi:hypothetical protein